MFWWAGALLGIPAHPGYQASLLQQPSIPSSFLIVAVVMAGCVLIGTALAGMVRFDAGLFSAAIGLSALSLRGASSRHVIFWALERTGAPAIFARLLLETLILTMLIAACWWALRALNLKGILKDREPGEPPHSGSSVSSVANEVASIAVQAIATALGILLLAPTEAKQQVLAAVFISSFFGPVVAQMLHRTGPRGWHWLPPLLVGMAGFAAAYFEPAGAATASLSGTFSPLARPLPLDYASAGLAGAIAGYWMARRWQRAREAEHQSPANA
jgi:hypothetical protein